MLNRLKTKNIKLARIRYFDVKRNGAELGDIPAYAILYKTGEGYINLFDLESDIPVFERSRYYGEYSSDGSAIGAKLEHRCGELKDGPCYVISSDVVKFPGEYVTLEELERYIINSDKFFVDRIELFRNISAYSRFKYRNKIKKDSDNLDKLREYFASYGSGFQYRKGL